MLRITFLAVGLAVCAAEPSAQTDCSFFQPPTVAFDDGEDVLGSSVGDRIYGLLYRCPDVGLVLTGTADSTETEPGALAERRAAAVAAALVADGFSADRFSAVGAGVGETRRTRQVSIESVALTELPGWTPRGPDHDPDPVEQDLLAEQSLRLDWSPVLDGCAGDVVGDGALGLAAVLYTAGYHDHHDLAVGCIRSASPGARYVPTHSARIADGVTVLDGTMGEGRDALAVGWLVGPSGSTLTDGRFCARYTDASARALRALDALATSPGDAAAEAAVGTAVDALWPFADAVAAVGGEVQVLALDCRQIVFYEQAL